MVGSRAKTFRRALVAATAIAALGYAAWVWVPSPTERAVIDAIDVDGRGLEVRQDSRAGIVHVRVDNCDAPVEHTDLVRWERAIARVLEGTGIAHELVVHCHGALDEPV